MWCFPARCALGSCVLRAFHRASGPESVFFSASCIRFPGDGRPALRCAVWQLLVVWPRLWPLSPAPGSVSGGSTARCALTRLALSAQAFERYTFVLPGRFPALAALRADTLLSSIAPELQMHLRGMRPERAKPSRASLGGFASSGDLCAGRRGSVGRRAVSLCVCVWQLVSVAGQSVGRAFEWASAGFSHAEDKDMVCEPSARPTEVR